MSDKYPEEENNTLSQSAISEELIFSEKRGRRPGRLISRLNYLSEVIETNYPVEDVQIASEWMRRAANELERLYKKN